MSFYNTWLLPRVLDLVMQQKQMPVEPIGQAASARTLDIGIGSGLSLAFYGEHTGQVVASEVGRSDVYEYSVTEQHGAAKSDDPKPGEPDVALPSHPTVTSPPTSRQAATNSSRDVMAAFIGRYNDAARKRRSTTGI